MATSLVNGRCLDCHRSRDRMAQASAIDNPRMACAQNQEPERLLVSPLPSAAAKTETVPVEAAPPRRRRPATAAKEPATPRRTRKPATDGPVVEAAAVEAEVATPDQLEDEVDLAVVVGPEPTVEEVLIAPEAVDVKFAREGDDVVLTVGGKRRSLDDVDDSSFEEAKEAVVEKELSEDEGFIVSDADDADEPEQQVMVAGATADPVKDYLKQIGKVALLNAEQEVTLAKRIEAGLFAEESR